MIGKQLRNSILQWAIQGKLVPQDPNDEPASVLLERIRTEKARLVKEKKIKKDKNESIIFRGEDNSYYEKMADGTVRCIDSEIPFDIPDSWGWVRLGSIFAHNSGKALNGNGGAGEPHPYLTTSNVYWNSFDLSKVKTMNFSNEELKKCSISKGDLLVCEGGDIGRAAIWCYDYEICIQNHLHRLRAYCPICTAFFYLVFLLYKGSGVIGGKGIGIQGLSSGALHNILLPFPPLSEQERIKSVVDRIEPNVAKYEELYNKYTSINKEIYDLLKKSILQEAIQGRLVPQIESEGTAEQLLAEIQAEKERLVKEGKLKKSALASESRIFRGEDNRYYEQIGSNTIDITDLLLFDIPENWRWCRLSTVIQLLSGRDLEPNEYNDTHKGLPYMTGASNFSDEKLIVNRWTEKPVTISTKGDLLITCKGTIGQMAFNTIGEIHVARQIMAISGNRINLRYLKFFLESMMNTLQKQAKSMIPGISRDVLLNTLFPLPPIAEQNRIVHELSESLQKMK